MMQKLMEAAFANKTAAAKLCSSNSEALTQRLVRAGRAHHARFPAKPAQLCEVEP